MQYDKHHIKQYTLELLLANQTYKNNMETKKTIYQLHEDHKIWLNKLAFYKDEILIMRNRISEVAKKNTSKEVLAFIEHFQNQLIVQKEQIDIINHELNLHEKELEAAADKNRTAIDKQKFNDHPKHRDAVNMFEKIFNDLRKELINFLCKCM